ncbi:MAG: efflux RND transporter periplasmic adaptor subunit [Planctomycetota bacterium]
MKKNHILARFAVASAKTVFVILVAVAVLIGLGMFLAPPEVHENKSAIGGNVIYTCSMHPQIRVAAPGNCPLCGMKLTATEDRSASGAGTILSEHGRKVARVDTVKIARGPAIVAIETVGYFKLDERYTSKIASWAEARVEKVYVPFRGAEVREGEPLVDLYVSSLPLLILELKIARTISPEASSAILERLRRIGVSNSQIEQLEKTENPEPRFTMVSPKHGIIKERFAEPGMVAKDGDVLFELIQLDPLVLEIEVYEKDLLFVGPGSECTYSILALPNEQFAGKIEIIKTFANNNARTLQARVPVQNPRGLARPDMSVRAEFKIRLGADGKPAITATHTNATDPLLLPKSALLDAGRRKIVYVLGKENAYEMREVTLGPRSGDYYIILSGLAEGESVVSRGAFLIDSQTQIEGKPSLIFIEGSSK